jgi:hypothetical protein
MGFSGYRKKKSHSYCQDWQAFAIGAISSSALLGHPHLPFIYVLTHILTWTSFSSLQVQVVSGRVLLECLHGVEII